MADGQKIHGVPPGYEIQRIDTHLRAFESDGATVMVYATVHLQRISKPKRSVVVAEADLTKHGVSLNRNAHIELRMPGYSIPVDDWRIEEREA